MTQIDADARAEHWTPPEGLSTAVPRTVRMRSGYLALTILLVAFLITPVIFAGGKLPNIAIFLYGLLIGFILVLMVVAYARERYLLRWGGIAPARMTTESRPQYRGMYSNKYVTVAYSFTDKDGNTVKAQIEMRARQASGANRDRMLEMRTVLYDPRNSRRNILYPPSTVELQEQ